MIQVLIVIAVAVVALGVGAYMQRQAPDAPSTPTKHTTPQQVNRDDFVRPDAPWLVAVFTSKTCETCAKVWTSTQLLASGDVAVQNVEVVDNAELHKRYNITAVPSVVIADEEGVARASFLGPPSSSELWDSLNELRSA